MLSLFGSIMGEPTDPVVVTKVVYTFIILSFTHERIYPQNIEMIMQEIIRNRWKNIFFSNIVFHASIRDIETWYRHLTWMVGWVHSICV